MFRLCILINYMENVTELHSHIGEQWISGAPHWYFEQREQTTLSHSSPCHKDKSQLPVFTDHWQYHSYFTLPIYGPHIHM